MSGHEKMTGRSWPTGRIEGPSPSLCWQLWQLETDPVLREAARQAFVAACEVVR